MSAAEPLPRFDGIEDILGFAFAMQSKQVRPKGMSELASKGTNPSELTQYERIADGMMYYRAAMTALASHVGWIRAVLAWYTVPTDYDLKRVKLENAYWLAVLLQSRRPSVSDQWCAFDLISGWAYHQNGFRNPKHSYDWWADHLGIPRKKILHWATYDGPRTKGMLPAANKYLKDAENHIRENFEYRGIL